MGSSKSRSSTPEARFSRGVASSVGRIPSICSAFENESDPGAPGRGRPSTAVSLDASMEPPRSVSEDRPTYPKSGDKSPYCTVYRKFSVSVPEPETYVASRSVAPASSSSAGEPVTLTGSENSTCTSIRLPCPYAPSGVGDPTPATNGGLNADRTYAAPRLSSWPGPPTANSVDPSPSRSPKMATDLPNPVAGAYASPGTVVRLASRVSFTYPSGLSSIR